MMLEVPVKPPDESNIDHPQSKRTVLAVRMRQGVCANRFAANRLAKIMTASNLPTTLERDPVCGMNVNPASAKHVHEHGGKKYYFCCACCVEKFKADPPRYLNKPAPFSSNLVMLGTPAPAKSSPSPHAVHAHTVDDPARVETGCGSSGICLSHVSRGS